jgi:hypothetical protein
MDILSACIVSSTILEPICISVFLQTVIVSGYRQYWILLAVKDAAEIF